jgi:hypothetical protein
VSVQAPPPASDEPDEPQHLHIQQGNDGPLLGRWTKQALEALEGKPSAWRREWLRRHQIELAEVRWSRPDYCDRIEAAAAPDEEA